MSAKRNAGGTGMAAVCRVLAIVALSVCMVLVSGVATTQVARADGPSPNVADSSESYGWTDCGKDWCTFYFTRSATKVVDDYFSNTPDLSVSTGVLCGVLGARFGPLAGVAFGVVCGEGTAPLDWSEPASEAADHGGCFQIAWNTAWWGRLAPHASWTEHPSYCFG